MKCFSVCGDRNGKRRTANASRLDRTTRRRHPVAAVLALAAAISVLTGCAPKVKSIEDPRLVSNLTGLVQDVSKLPIIVYQRHGRTPLGAYDSFMVEPARVNIRDEKLADLKPENVRRLQNYLTEALVEALTDAGFKIVAVPQGNTLRINTVLGGFKASKAGGVANVGVMAAGAVTGVPVIFAVSVGALTIEAEFIDAVSGETDAVILVRQQGSRIFNPSPWSTWSDVERSMTEFAEGFAETVSEAQRK